MPFGAVFTSSAGGDIGGGRLRTRFRGPILAGYASTADPGGQTLQSTGNVAGSAAQPMYSFYTRPDMGFYAASVTTAAPDLRFSQGGFDVLSFSSAQVGFVGSSQASLIPMVAAAGLCSASSLGVGAALYIYQTTYGVSSSTNANIITTPTPFNSGAALIFDSARKKISVFSTVIGDWLSVTLSCS